MSIWTFREPDPLQLMVLGVEKGKVRASGCEKSVGSCTPTEMIAESPLGGVDPRKVPRA